MPFLPQLLFLPISIYLSLSVSPPEASIQPPALKPGDIIGLAAPAGPLDATSLRRAVENLKGQGYDVRIAYDPRDRRGYLAADDDTRAAALNLLIRDPEVKAIICARGGYGSPRILDRIDYDALARNPKIVVGYSDITALLLAIRRKTNLVCFHGPMAREWGLGKGPTPFSDTHFWGAVRPDAALFEDWGGKRPRGLSPPGTLVGGVAEGFLIGGNLSLVTSLMGTPYEIDTRDGILFLEDVMEKPFRIDRMLNQLRLAGKLAEVRGVLLGGFVGCDASNSEEDLPLAEVFTDYFGPLGVPVLSGYPAGHVPENVTLPFGVRVRLDATEKTLTLLESPVAE